MRGAFGRFVVFILLALFALPSSAAPLTVAAAADLKFALEDITAAFRRLHPEAQVDVVYGSSGKLQTQIRNGAPFDLFSPPTSTMPARWWRPGLHQARCGPMDGDASFPGARVLM
jgi:molybdate transport system substrate-binding protein